MQNQKNSFYPFNINQYNNDLSQYPNDMYPYREVPNLRTLLLRRVLKF